VTDARTIRVMVVDDYLPFAEALQIGVDLEQDMH
jgi:hypothetical protein